jgi:hypothetical protein
MLRHRLSKKIETHLQITRKLKLLIFFFRVCFLKWMRLCLSNTSKAFHTNAYLKINVSSGIATSESIIFQAQILFVRCWLQPRLWCRFSQTICLYENLQRKPHSRYLRDRQMYVQRSRSMCAVSQLYNIYKYSKSTDGISREDKLSYLYI